MEDDGNLQLLDEIIDCIICNKSVNSAVSCMYHHLDSTDNTISHNLSKKYTQSSKNSFPKIRDLTVNVKI